MRIEIPHTLSKDEVRRRIAARMGDAQDKVGGMIGGTVDLALHWIDEDRLAVDATAMGYTVPSTMDITDDALVFEVTIPPGLGFARGMIETMIRGRGEKLLA
ncbi:polyhydroxyalkanoic acid system family protein [Novosphingobium sp.]|uniref:polyhydroxyalkanoic acid system family protein n=1 Tax=Novosphingobium sp. TaxID=1874826 RepID=UPI003D10DE2E